MDKDFHAYFGRLAAKVRALPVGDAKRAELLGDLFRDCGADEADETKLRNDLFGRLAKDHGLTSAAFPTYKVETGGAFSVDVDLMGMSRVRALREALFEANADEIKKCEKDECVVAVMDSLMCEFDLTSTPEARAKYLAVRKRLDTLDLRALVKLAQGRERRKKFVEDLDAKLRPDSNPPEFESLLAPGWDSDPKYAGLAKRIKASLQGGYAPSVSDVEELLVDNPYLLPGAPEKILERLLPRVSLADLVRLGILDNKEAHKRAFHIVAHGAVPGAAANAPLLEAFLQFAERNSILAHTFVATKEFAATGHFGKLARFEIAGSFHEKWREIVGPSSRAAVSDKRRGRAAAVDAVFGKTQMRDRLGNPTGLDLLAGRCDRPQDPLILRVEDFTGKRTYLHLTRPQKVGDLDCVAVADVTDRKAEGVAAGRVRINRDAKYSVVPYARLLASLEGADAGVQTVDVYREDDRQLTVVHVRKSADRKDEDGNPVDEVDFAGNMTPQQAQAELDLCDAPGKVFGMAVGMMFRIGQDVDAKKRAADMGIRGDYFQVRAIADAGLQLTTGQWVAWGEFVTAFKKCDCARVPSVTDAKSFLHALTNHAGEAKPWAPYAADGAGAVSLASSVDDKAPAQLRFVLDRKEKKAYKILAWGAHGVVVQSAKYEEKTKEKGKEDKVTKKKDGTMEYSTEFVFVGEDGKGPKPKEEVLNYAEFFQRIKGKGSSLPDFTPRTPTREVKSADEKEHHLHGGIMEILKTFNKGGFSIGNVFGGVKLIKDVWAHSLEEHSKMGELRMARHMAKLMGMKGGEIGHEIDAKITAEEKKLGEELFNRIKDRPGKHKARMIRHILDAKSSQQWEVRAAFHAVIEGYGVLYPEDSSSGLSLQEYEGSYLWYRRFGFAVGDKHYVKYHENCARAGKHPDERELLYEAMKTEFGDDAVNAKWWVPMKIAVEGSVEENEKRGKGQTAMMEDADSINNYVFGRFETGEYPNGLGGYSRMLDVYGDPRQVNEIPFITAFSGIAKQLPYTQWKETYFKLHRKKGYLMPPFLFLSQENLPIFRKVVIDMAYGVDAKLGKQLEGLQDCWTKGDYATRQTKLRQLRQLWAVHGADLMKKLSGQDPEVMVRAKTGRPEDDHIKRYYDHVKKELAHGKSDEDLIEWGVYDPDNWPVLWRPIMLQRRLSNTEWYNEHPDQAKHALDSYLKYVSEKIKIEDVQKTLERSRGVGKVSNDEARSACRTLFEEVYTALLEMFTHNPKILNDDVLRKIRPYGLFANENTIDNARKSISGLRKDPESITRAFNVFLAESGQGGDKAASAPSAARKTARHTEEEVLDVLDRDLDRAKSAYRQANPGVPLREDQDGDGAAD